MILQKKANVEMLSCWDLCGTVGSSWVCGGTGVVSYHSQAVLEDFSSGATHSRAKAFWKAVSNKENVLPPKRVVMGVFLSSSV